MAEVFMSEGLSFRKLNNYQEALVCFDKAIQENPFLAEAFYAKGFALEELGKYQEAIDSYDQAIESYSSFYQAHNNKGSALIDLGMYSEAIKSFDAAISIKPDFPQAYNNKGFALQSLGMYQDAIECFDKAIKLRYDDPKAHYNRGLAMRSLGNYEEAIASLEKARGLKTNCAVCLCYIASCKLSLARENEAIEGFKTALELIEDSSVKQTDIKDEDMNAVKEALKKILGLVDILKERIEGDLDAVKEESVRVISNINFQKGTNVWDLEDLILRLKEKRVETKQTESGFKVKNWPTNGEEINVESESGVGVGKHKRMRVEYTNDVEVPEEEQNLYTEGGDDPKHVVLEFENKDNKECCSIF